MKIENRLKELAHLNSNYSLLLSQWEFDKKLLTRALNTIGRDYPHYSLHDSSHSSTIISQIEKIISKDIKNLSATDCWLILESCYWHDAGMIVSDQDKKIILNSDDFKNYIKHHKSISSDMLEYINIIEESENINTTTIYEQSRALTFILADYFRINHAERSGGYVNSPQAIQIMSPRTSLIPSRLFGFVSDIVSCHGKSKDEILKIAKCNDGMDSDDYAHPRYVAGLLRIGDLLDIDDGRFCHTMLSSIGTVPSLSYAHQQKHSSIKHLYIDSNSIEIKSICPDYDSFEAQNAWFDYLKEELRFQSENWIDIIPESNYGTLPIIKELSCKVDGYIDIDGKAPRLELYNKRVYDYLSSSFLYSEKFPFVREAIQNSLDSIYYKVWSEQHSSDKWNDESGSEVRTSFNRRLQDEKLELSISRGGISDDKITYVFEIKDYGMGISFDNIKKILKVGSPLSRKQNSIQSTMPDWAKPSGFFGLGMQSIFKMSNDAEIITRSANGEEFTINSTLTTNQEVKLKIKKTDTRKTTGATVRVYFDYLRVPNSISYGQFDYLRAYDPIKDDILEVVPSLIEEAIISNFKLSNVPIYMNDILLISPLDDQENIKENVSTNFDLGVDFDLYIDLNDISRNIFRYKGVPFDSKVSIEGVAGNCDIFSRNAAHWLTIDRKKQNPDSSHELGEILNKLVEREYKTIKLNSSNKYDADFYFYTLFSAEGCESWGDAELNGIKIKDYLEGSKKLIISNLHESGGIKHDRTSIFSWGFRSRLLGKLIKKLGVSFKIVLDKQVPYKLHNRELSYEDYSIEFAKESPTCYSIDIDLVKIWLEQKPNAGCARSMVPLYDMKYFNICLDLDDIEPWMYCHTDFTSWFTKVLLLPARDQHKAVDLEAIYSFYLKKNRCVIDKKEFIQMYNELWEELGF